MAQDSPGVQDIPGSVLSSTLNRGGGSGRLKHLVTLPPTVRKERMHAAAQLPFLFSVHAVQDPSQGMAPPIVGRTCPINEQQSQQSSTDVQRPISRATLDSAQLTILTITLCFQLTEPQKKPLPESLRMFVPL